MRLPFLFSAQLVLHETEDDCVCDDQAQSVDKPNDPELARLEVTFTIPHQQPDGNSNVQQYQQPVVTTLIVDGEKCQNDPLCTREQKRLLRTFSNQSINQSINQSMIFI